jgi:hypothetical protein
MIQNIAVLLCVIMPLYSLLSFNLLPQMTRALLITEISPSDFHYYGLTILAVYLVAGLIGGLLTSLLVTGVYALLFGEIQAITLEITCGLVSGGMLLFAGKCFVVIARHWDRMT